MYDSLISRKAAIDVVRDVMLDFIEYEDEIEVPMSDTDKQLFSIKKAISKRIKALPSAQPEHKKGHWIVFETDDDMYVCVKCSCCGKSYTIDSRRRVDIGFVKEDLCYCPNCGADMSFAIRRCRNEKKKSVKVVSVLR